MANVDDFKAKLIGGGARSNLFKVTCNFPGFASGNVELTSFMCKAASIPASTVAAIAVPFRGRVVNVAGDRTFEPWSLTIINDNDMGIRNSFETWLNGMNEHENNFGLASPSDYQVDMFVEQLDRKGETTKRYDFKGCFPTSLSAIDLAYDSNDAIEEFTVELTYNYWTAATTT